MITPKNLIIFGSILLFVGICLPFFLIASRGLGQSSTVSVKRKQEVRTFKQKSFDFIWASIIMLCVLPVVISTVYHFIQNVFWGGMAFNDFTHSLSSYSYGPVVEFYKQLFMQINTLLTKPPSTPQ